MKFTKAIEANGTHLQGNVGATYQELVEVFGEPIRYDSDGTTHMNNKTDAEWRISFEDGTIATIYNYKNGLNYLAAQIARYWQINEQFSNSLIVRRNRGLTSPFFLAAKRTIVRAVSSPQQVTHRQTIVRPAQAGAGNKKNKKSFI